MVAYGISLIQAGQVTIGLLIGFLLYVNNFYGPMRQLAAVWASFQLAMAALDRISEVLALESNMPVIEAPKAESASVLSFRQVWFHYPDGKEVLRDVSFEMERGKAYALVGPTGGGKTTTANLMARLYDPTQGSVLFEWTRHPVVHGGGARAKNRIHSAGPVPVQRHRARQHRLR